MRWSHWLAAMASSVALLGCNPDTAVFVEATIENGNLAMTGSALSTGVSGSFDLRLHLADRAAESSEVSLIGFAITDGNVNLVEVVGATTDKSFPVTVDVGSDVVVKFSLAAEDNLVDNADAMGLCGIGGVFVSGAVDDSLRGASVDIESPPIQVSGCP